MLTIILQWPRILKAEHIADAWIAVYSTEGNNHCMNVPGAITQPGVAYVVHQCTNKPMHATMGNNLCGC